MFIHAHISFILKCHNDLDVFGSQINFSAFGTNENCHTSHARNRDEIFSFFFFRSLLLKFHHVSLRSYERERIPQLFFAFHLKHDF